MGYQPMRMGKLPMPQLDNVLVGKIMIRAYLSIAGGLHDALLKAEELGAECVQIFTINWTITQWS